MAVFFTADTHFGHGGALGLFRRPFGSVAEMNEVMIERWNETVRPDDEVWHLGDVAMGIPAAEIAGILDRLNGGIRLLIGNNDRVETLAWRGFLSVQHYVELKLDGLFLVLCHYPFRSWRKMNKKSLNLHGHAHGGMKPMTRQIDVGVDVWDFRPIGLEELRARRGRLRKSANV